MTSSQLKDFSKPFLEAACKLWNLKQPKFISDAENLIFACQSSTGKYALRLTHPSHRSLDQLGAEISWIGKLRQHSIPVVTPKRSINQNFVEPIAIANTTWLTSATHWIDGHPISPRNNEISADTARAWGSLTGQIISQSLSMNRSKIRLPRPHWDQATPGQETLSEQLSPKQAKLSAELKAAKSSVAAIPKTESNYLLAHTDLHQGNVLQTPQGTLVALDFDDASYHYLIQEVAMPIYYLLHRLDSDHSSGAKRFLSQFLPGLREHHDIDLDAFDAIPLIFQLRDLELEAITHVWDIPEDNPWANRVHHIYEHGNPISQLPWKKWAAQI